MEEDLQGILCEDIVESYTCVLPNIFHITLQSKKVMHNFDFNRCETVKLINTAIAKSIQFTEYYALRQFLYHSLVL